MKPKSGARRATQVKQWTQPENTRTSKSMSIRTSQNVRASKDTRTSQNVIVRASQNIRASKEYKCQPGYKSSKQQNIMAVAQVARRMVCKKQSKQLMLRQRQ